MAQSFVQRMGGRLAGHRRTVESPRPWAAEPSSPRIRRDPAPRLTSIPGCPDAACDYQVRWVVRHCKPPPEPARSITTGRSSRLSKARSRSCVSSSFPSRDDRLHRDPSACGEASGPLAVVSKAMGLCRCVGAFVRAGEERGPIARCDATLPLVCAEANYARAFVTVVSSVRRARCMRADHRAYPSLSDRLPSDHSTIDILHYYAAACSGRCNDGTPMSISADLEMALGLMSQPPRLRDPRHSERAGMDMAATWAVSALSAATGSRVASSTECSTRCRRALCIAATAPWSVPPWVCAACSPRAAI